MAEITHQTETMFTLRISENEFNILQAAMWNYCKIAHESEFTSVWEITALSGKLDDADRAANNDCGQR